jgi:hypothetical protein
MASVVVSSSSQVSSNKAASASVVSRRRALQREDNARYGEERRQRELHADQPLRNAQKRGRVLHRKEEFDAGQAEQRAERFGRGDDNQQDSQPAMRRRQACGGGFGGHSSAPSVLMGTLQ